MIEYNHNWYELDAAMKDVEKRTEESLDDEWDKVAPTAQQTEGEDEEEGVQESDIFPQFDPPNTTISEYSDLSAGNDETDPNEDVQTHYLPEDDYSDLLRSLNTEQREFFLHVLSFENQR